MLNALGHHIHLSWPKRDNSIPQMNIQHAFQDEKKIVRIVVLVPNKLPLYLDHHQVMPVELTDHAGLPVF